MVTRVATRYAKALLQLAIEQHVVDEVERDFAMIGKAIHGSHDLLFFLIRPTVPDLIKERILKEIFTDKISSLSAKFITLLAHKGRSEELPSVADAFNHLVNLYRNVTAAKITVATELSAEQKMMIEGRIKQMSNMDVKATYHVDPSIIGGFRAVFEDTLIDATVRHQLERLRDRLAGDSLSDAVATKHIG